MSYYYENDYDTHDYDYDQPSIDINDSYEEKF